MQAAAEQTRRDHRFPVREGCGRVELELAPGEVIDGVLSGMSVSGFSVRLPELPAALGDGAHVERASVRVLDCELRGEVIVRFVRRDARGGASIGCVFYPDGERTAECLMALLAGLEAAGD